MDQEVWSRFEQRKRDHIDLAKDSRHQAIGASDLDRIRLLHDAIPEIDFADIDLSVDVLGQKARLPLFVSSMTLGHQHSEDLNHQIIRVATQRGWAVGLGSQRRQLSDPLADKECQKLRAQAPHATLFGNIGLSQLIRTKFDAVKRLVDSLEAQALCVHLNPLQECLQPEGTPQFRGGLRALEDLTQQISVPVIVKETGCGMSATTLQKLKGIGFAAVDVSGLGGTHWGRIEGARSLAHDPRAQVADDLASWGVSTVDSVLAAVKLEPDFAIWASGGVRSGLDVAKLLALGARNVGIAQPILTAALEGEQVLDRRMESIEYGLKTAMFCMGLATIESFRTKKEIWQWQKA